MKEMASTILLMIFAKADSLDLIVIKKFGGDRKQTDIMVVSQALESMPFESRIYI